MRIPVAIHRDVDTRYDELELLSDAALALSELGPDEDVFRFITERLAPLAPNSLVMTARYDASGERATVCAVAGPEEMLRVAREVAGEPIGQAFALDEEARQTLSEGKLRDVPGGMHQLTFRRWPAAVWERPASIATWPSHR